MARSLKLRHSPPKPSLPSQSPMLLKLHQVSLEAPLNQTGQCLILAELILPAQGDRSKGRAQGPQPL
jgi:hypothetical protein